MLEALVRCNNRLVMVAFSSSSFIHYFLSLFLFLSLPFHFIPFLVEHKADAAVYNTLINACAGVGDLEKALETVQAMQVRFRYHCPSSFTYGQLILLFYFTLHLFTPSEVFKCN